ncbi:MAG TPA: toll/interleukin-1 receptor domain-containing protein [Thermoanaerobaculia bacterium]|nr:toll/interleukin-1 receptor domain-containing protein [Thermoanaerobaculia bacterium]
MLVLIPRSDAESVWRALSNRVRSLEAHGLIALERVTPPTENALRKRLAGTPVDALHFIGTATSRRAAQYGTLLLENSTGGARSVSTQYFGELLAQHPSLKVALLETNERPSTWEHGPEVVLDADKFYASIADAPPPQPSPPAAPVPAPAPVVAAPVVVDVFANELKRKRAAEEFDVFLCHNTFDKPQVKRVADELERRGILPWLDIRELPPGQPWQPLLEKQIGSIKSAAVFVGSAGVGPWQEQELYGFISEFVSRRSPVIPVLLRDAPEKPKLPIFLRSMMWVDFRASDPDPLAQLIWGITGIRPE